MILIGAKGHAKEVLDILESNEIDIRIYLFDDISKNIPNYIFNKYKVLRSIDTVKIKFETDNRYILALGNPKNRKLMDDKFKSIGGLLTSVISKKIFISNNDVKFGEGLNIMHNVFISASTCIGKASLINTGVQIHHDVIIGEYCELAPQAVLLGNVQVGSFTSIGSNATILPGISIGDNCIIGAGSVVTRNVPNNCLAVGVPAKIIKEIPLINV